MVHKDISLYKRYYGIPEAKARYIPFKANNYEIRDQFVSNDGGYILSCGASYRDYGCLISAAKKVALPIIILLPKADIAALHNTYVDIRDLPNNVSVIIHDMNKFSWNKYIANAKMIVIPIRKDCIQPAGISAYLECMMLGKPVIISRGPSTNQIVHDNMAMLYDPGDSEALAQCINRLIDDRMLCSKLAENGKNYALSLEGEMRLVKDIERNVIEMFNEKLFKKKTV